MRRVILLIMDGFGIGHAKDSDKFFNGDKSDKGSNTLANIARATFTKKKNYLPVLTKLGLVESYKLVSKNKLPNMLDDPKSVVGVYGCAAEKSLGKDSPSGHREICGNIVDEPMHYFINKYDSIDASLLSKLATTCGVEGFLANCKISGIEVIKNYGDKHLQTKKPIIYTSSDSVIQIAASEEVFGLDRLYTVCQKIRTYLDENQIKVGRVIARPFTTDENDKFEKYKRTERRKDFMIELEPSNLLDNISDVSGVIHAFGKINDIFSMKNIHYSYRPSDNHDLSLSLLKVMDKTNNDRHPTFLFANYNDFDSKYGHRRNPKGYLQALVEFETDLLQILTKMQDTDLLIITADHGNDPTWYGSDHTRENVPILCYNSKIKSRSIGYRDSMTDIGQSIASYLNIKKLKQGKSFL